MNLWSRSTEAGVCLGCRKRLVVLHDDLKHRGPKMTFAPCGISWTAKYVFFFFPSLGGVKSDRDHEITPFFSWGEAKNANGWWIFKRNFMEFLWISPKIRAILWVGTHERKMPKMPESDKQLVCFLSPGLQDPSSTGEITAKGMMLGLCPWPSVNLSNEQKPWLFAVGGFYYPANIGIVRS